MLPHHHHLPPPRYLPRHCRVLARAKPFSEAVRSPAGDTGRCSSTLFPSTHHHYHYQHHHHHHHHHYTISFSTLYTLLSLHTAERRRRNAPVLRISTHRPPLVGKQHTNPFTLNHHSLTHPSPLSTVYHHQLGAQALRETAKHIPLSFSSLLFSSPFNSPPPFFTLLLSHTRLHTFLTLFTF
jgi:hypothetical protein